MVKVSITHKVWLSEVCQTLCFKCDVRSGLSSFLTVTEWLNISRGPLLICPPGINVWVLAIEQWRHTHKHSEHKVLTKQLFLFYAEKHTFTIQTQIWSPLPVQRNPLQALSDSYRYTSVPQKVQLLLWKEDINCSICYFGGLGQQLKVAMEPIFEPTVQSQQNNK